MKKNFLTALSGLAFLLLLTAGCQKEELTNPGKLTTRGAADADIYYSANPTCQGEEVTVYFDNGSGSNCGQSRIQVWGPNDTDWVTFLGNTLPVNGVVSKSFTPALAGEYRFRGSYQRTGSMAACPNSNENVVNFEDESLTVENCGCQTSLVAEASCSGNDRTASYVFTHEGDIDYVKIQGGLTNFSGDAEVLINGVAVDFNSVSPDGWDTGVVGDYTVGQRTPGGSSNRTIRVEGPASCEVLVITLNWSTTEPKGEFGEITGEWTVVDEDGAELAAVSDLMCP